MDHEKFTSNRIQRVNSDVFQVDFSDAAKLESGWDSQEAKEEDEDFWS